MRVAHLIWGFHVGGLERVVYRLVTALPELGIDASVIAYGEDGDFRASFENAGIPTAFFPDPGQPRPPSRVLGSALASVRLTATRAALPLRVARHIREHDIDLLHTHHFGPLLFGRMATRLARVPMVHTEHSREAYESNRKRETLWRFAREGRVVSVSRELQSWFASELSVASSLIPNGVPVPPQPTPSERAEVRDRLGLSHEHVVVGCVARLSFEKNHDLLIRAAALAAESHPNLRLVLVGDGPDADAVRRGAHEALGDAVQLLGERHDVESIYPAFDVIALSSRREGLPLALLEGMARSTPAVATEVGEVPGLLAGGGGIVVGPRDVAGFASALSTYAADPDRRAADGAHARALVEADYSAAAMVSAYTQLYRTVLGA